MAEVKSRLPLVVDVRMGMDVAKGEEEAEEGVKEEIKVIIEEGDNDVRISLISDKNVFFHVVHYMNNSIYETSFKLNQKMISPFAMYPSIIKKLINSCNDKPKEFVAVLRRDVNSISQIQGNTSLLSAVPSSAVSNSASFLGGLSTKSSPSINPLKRKRSIVDLLSSQNESFHLDFISHTEFKTFELLSCQFVGLPDDVVKRIAQQRFDDLLAKNIEIEQKLNELETLLKAKKTPSALLSQTNSLSPRDENFFSSSFTSSSSSSNVGTSKRLLKTPPGQTISRLSLTVNSSNSSGRKVKE